MRTTPFTTLKTFYILLITQTISMLGRSMIGFAIGIRLFLETGKTTPLLLVASVLVYALPVVRHVERDLPDYKIEPRQEQEASPVGMEQAVAGAI